MRRLGLMRYKMPRQSLPYLMGIYIHTWEIGTARLLAISAPRCINSSLLIRQVCRPLWLYRPSYKQHGYLWMNDEMS